ncbi:MAG: hypothetical protein V7636_1312 [Actinomycetota bacterium]
MRAGRTIVDRYLALTEHRIVPALASAGFVANDGRFERVLDDVLWLAEIELAPWSSEDKVCFTLAWGVAIPGLDDALGDDVRTDDCPATCPINGRLGERAPGLEATWFAVVPVRVPGLEVAVDARTAQGFARLVGAELVPMLEQLDTVPAVQARLVANLVRGRGAAANGELRSIRWIAGLSLLLGERENASRWLDYLEARSSASIAPDVVSERMAALRRRCAS